MRLSLDENLTSNEQELNSTDRFDLRRQKESALNTELFGVLKNQLAEAQIQQERLNFALDEVRNLIAARSSL